MTFKELLNKKKISGYSLSKNTGIPYTTINDLINGKTIIQNISLKNALLIADFLNVDVSSLAKLETQPFVEFRYFRNNVLTELKNVGFDRFLTEIIKNKEIDFYYKNKGWQYAYYLLALIDYLCRINNRPIYDARYNELRKNKLTNPFFVGSDLIRFDSVEQAEKDLGIEIIPEFKKYNIIEHNVFNVEWYINNKNL